MKTIEINGEIYVKESDIQTNQMATNTDGLQFVIIRTYSAGVHAGYLESRDGKEVNLVNAIRLYCWDGAFTLSNLAMFGIMEEKESNCKFSKQASRITLTEAIEIIECTEVARQSIEGVKPHEIN